MDNAWLYMLYVYECVFSLSTFVMDIADYEICNCAVQHISINIPQCYIFSAHDQSCAIA